MLELHSEPYQIFVKHVMDGMKAKRRLRRLERADAGKIPVIALTADAFSDAKKEIMCCGMTAYLAKPVYPEQLYETLEHVLRKMDMTEEISHEK